MPSSSNRRRVEIPSFMYDRVHRVAVAEGRTVAGVITELLHRGIERYHPTWVESRDLGQFNPRSRRVLDRARQEATDLRQDYVGTEHLLLGLIGEEGGIAADVLADLGVTPQAVRAAIERCFGRGAEPVADTLGFTARARVVLGLAIEEVDRMGGGPVRTEHILLALVRYGGGLGVEVLDEVGVLGRVRGAILQRLGQPAASGS
ncbi:MAG: hypothetical protein JOZ41_09700 [Chloroflexi bacterium]|nr:hypothetical protein [Chloroflexota bacterium]